VGPLGGFLLKARDLELLLLDHLVPVHQLGADLLLLATEPRLEGEQRPEEARQLLIPELPARPDLRVLLLEAGREGGDQLAAAGRLESERRTGAL